MLRRQCLAMLAAAIAFGGAQAQTDTVKIGVILPMTGQQASTGRQIDAAIKLWVAQNGNRAGGKKVEIVLKDDGLMRHAASRRNSLSTTRSSRSPDSASRLRRWRPHRSPRRARRRWS